MDATDKQIERVCPQHLKEALPHQTLRVIFKTVNALNSAKRQGNQYVERYLKNMTQVQKDALKALLSQPTTEIPPFIVPMMTALGIMPD